VIDRFDIMSAFLSSIGVMVTTLVAGSVRSVLQDRQAGYPLRAAGLFARLAGRPLPARHRARYIEEWRAELLDLPSGRHRLVHAWGLLTRAPRVAWALRQLAAPRRGRHQYVFPLAAIADVEGWLAGAALVERDGDNRFRYRLMYARRQDNDVRIVVLTRYSRRDSAEEVAALVRQAQALGRVTQTAVRRKARQTRKVL
jgi:hypothetical protein